jgi:error-prone DNA polymerase
MPMGFYQPAQIVSDAQDHGVEVRPVDVNFSLWDNQLEDKSERYFALRLGFRQINGIRSGDVERLLLTRGQGYASIDALRDAGLSKAFLETLADADAFHSLGLDRRKALWQLSNLDFAIAMFQGLPAGNEEIVALPQMTLPEHVAQDYASTSLSLKAHPISLLRPKLEPLGIVRSKDLYELANGMPVKVAGIVLVRQRPETAKGVCFMTLEDETGFANLVVFPNVFEQNRKAILQSRLIMVEGKLQREGDVVHVIATACYNFSKLLRTFTPSTFNSTQFMGLKFSDGDADRKNNFPKGRNFH